MRVPALILSLACCAGASLPALADTLASYPQQPNVNQANNYLGEKFLTAGTGTYDDIVFNFITVANTAYATGTAFLLTQQYTGGPGGLSSSVAGFVGSTAASAGPNGTSFYDFASNLTLRAATTYYLYENALVPGGTVSGGFTAPSTYEEFYATSGNFQSQQGASLSFNLTGTPISGVSPVPEPSSLVLLAMGMIAGASALRHRRQ